MKRLIKELFQHWYLRISYAIYQATNNITYKRFYDLNIPKIEVRGELSD